jgi:hypothetical protein
MIRNALLVLGLYAGTIAAVPPGGSTTVTQPQQPPPPPAAPPLAPMPAATATPSPDPAMPARAKDEFAQLQSYDVYLVTFANGTKLNFLIAVDGHGKIAGMRLMPNQ